MRETLKRLECWSVSIPREGPRRVDQECFQRCTLNSTVWHVGPRECDLKVGLQGRALGGGHKDNVPLSACSLVQSFGPSMFPRRDQRGGEVDGMTCRVDIKTQQFAMDLMKATAVS